MKSASYVKEFIKTLHELSYSQSQIDIFRDFLILSCNAYANTIYRSKEIEDEYMQVVKKYSKEQMDKFVKLLSYATLALQDEPQDFLGTVFMSCDMGNNYRGQFFTPYNISKLNAQMILSSAGDVIDEKKYISVLEPTCGSGGMVIAAYEVLKKAGYDPREVMFVQAQDIDNLCYKMSYLQLSILDIPARVVWGDTLAVTEYQSWYTPAYALYGWEKKLEEKSVQKDILRKEIEEDAA